jgi:CBS domain containing-hemolysin-like protein
MRFTASIVIGVIGICLALLNCIAVIRTIAEGFMIAQQVVTIPDSSPSQLAAVIGETIIAVSSRGLFAILPAILIFIALVPLRLRERWFYRGAFASSIYFILVPPFATIFGIVLLILLRRRRSDFREGAVSTLDGDVKPTSASDPSLPPKSES